MGGQQRVALCARWWALAESSTQTLNYTLKTCVNRISTVAEGTL